MKIGMSVWERVTEAERSRRRGVKKRAQRGTSISLESVGFCRVFVLS